MCVAPPRRLPSHALHTKVTVVPPTTTSATRRRRRSTIRFAKHDEIYEIPHIDDMSDKEVDAVWLSREEMNEVRQEAKSIVSQIDQAVSMGLCIRGLDQHTKCYMTRRRAENDLIFEAVIRLQPFKERANGINVDMLIADLCTKYSKAAVAAAINRAKSDEQDAMAANY